MSLTGSVETDENQNKNWPLGYEDILRNSAKVSLSSGRKMSQPPPEIEPDRCE